MLLEMRRAPNSPALVDRAVVSPYSMESLTTLNANSRHCRRTICEKCAVRHHMTFTFFEFSVLSAIRRKSTILPSLTNLLPAARDDSETLFARLGTPFLTTLVDPLPLARLRTGSRLCFVPACRFRTCGGKRVAGNGPAVASPLLIGSRLLAWRGLIAAVNPAQGIGCRLIYRHLAIANEKHDGRRN